MKGTVHQVGYLLELLCWIAKWCRNGKCDHYLNTNLW